MLGTPLTTFEHSEFFSMVDRDDPQSIPDLFAANIENWIIRNVGELEMRDGLTARGTSPSATNLGEGVLRRANGTKHLVRVINGAGSTSKFQYSSNEGLTWSDISGGGSLSTDGIWYMTQANDILYAVSAGQTTRKYDGSTMSSLPSLPSGTAIEWWNNRLWILDATTLDKLWYSDANTPETFGGSSFLFVNLGDGSPGIGLRGSQSGRLYIGKERSVWYLFGDTPSDFVLRNLTYEHGVASPEAMIAARNDVWCIDQEGNARSLYRSQEDTPFSTIKSSEIQYTISGINKAALDRASGIFFDNFLMFFVPNGVDSHNSLVIVWDFLANRGKGGWTKFTGWSVARASVLIGDTPKLFLHDSRSGNGQSYEWAGTSDNGIAITAKYETKIYDHKVPERRKKWKMAYQFAPSSAGEYLRFYDSVDRGYYTLLKTIDLEGMGETLWDNFNWDEGTWSAGGLIRERIPFTDGGGINHGYSNQIKIEAESATTKIKVRKFTMHYRIFGLR